MALPGLSFLPGLRFQDEIRATLGLPVSSSSLDSFVLVASFGRCKFQLTPLSVGRLLQASLGGNASCFNAVQLGDRVFRFSVASKVVGFAIRRLGSFECDLFKVFFHLWGGSGPDWRSEFRSFLVAEEQAWKPAPSSRANGRSFAEVVRHPRASSGPPLSGANAVPLRAQPRLHVLNRLSFPDPSLPRGSSVHFRPWRGGAGKTRSFPCPRCLLPGHGRDACRWPIRCFACRSSVHAASACPGEAFKRRQALILDKGKKTAIDTQDWRPRENLSGLFRGLLNGSEGPSMQPPVFSSFREWAEACSSRPTSIPAPSTSSLPDLNVEPADWSLATPSASPPLLRAASVVTEGKKPQLPATVQHSFPLFTFL